MDHVLANKAVFKKTTDTLGNAALVSGAVLATRKETTAPAIGLLAFGLLNKIVAGGANPEADIRAWDNLPLYLSFVSLQVPTGPQTVTVEFLDGANRPIVDLTKTISVTLPESGDKVIYVNDHSKSPQTL